MNGLGEFLGTMVLIVLGVGTGAGVNLKTSYARNSGWLFITIAWGMAVTFGVYVAGSFGSQGHLNPAVTIPFAIFGFFPWDQVLPYLLGQFLGAFVGAVLVIIQYGAQFKNAKDSNDGNVVGIFATGPAINNGLYNFLSETIATFVWAPRFAYSVLPVPNKGDSNWGYAWVPMFGPLAGGLIAACVQYFLM